MMSKAIILDGDDTLWETMPLYQKAKDEFFQLMTACGWDRPEIERQFGAIDVANVRRFGFSRRRFPHSMVQTYRQFCKRDGIKPNIDTVAKATAFGERVFEQPVPLLPKVKPTLKILRKWFKLILVTKGDKEVQSMRINSSGLRPFLDEVHIVDDKSPKLFREVLDASGHSRRDSWSIGNSLRSDILPALEIGMRAIWVPYETWEYETDKRPRSRRLLVAKYFGDIKSLLPSAS